MANNVFGNRPNAVVARLGVTATFASLGLTAEKINVIYKVGTAYQSYIPGRGINPITAFEPSQGYLIMAKVDMDLSAYLIPPVTGTPAGTITTFTYGYNDSDVYIDDTQIPTIANVHTIPVIEGQPLVIDYPADAVGKFPVVQGPLNSSLKVVYKNGTITSDPIPGNAWRKPFIIDGYPYYMVKDLAGLAFDYHFSVILE